MNIFQLPADLCPTPSDEELISRVGLGASSLLSIVRPLLAREETLCHLAIQDRVRAMTFFPSALVLTNRRVMVVRRRIFGQTFLDMFWGQVFDAHLVENWAGGLFAVQSIHNEDLRIDALPVALARPAYAFGQRAEELAADWRRLRLLEEERARSRGVAITDVQQPLPLPTTPAMDTAKALRELLDLKEKGLISDDEYQQKRSSVLSRL